MLFRSGDDVEPGLWLTMSWLSIVVLAGITGYLLFRFLRNRGLTSVWPATVAMSTIIALTAINLRWPQGPFIYLLVASLGVVIIHGILWIITRKWQPSANRIASVLLILMAILVVTRGLLAMSGRESTKPNLVLLVWDTVRADRMSLYGYGYQNCMATEKLADHGLIFTGAHSSSNFTFASHVSIFTGLYNREHGLGYGIVDDLRAYSNLETLAGVLEEKGYRTLMETENSWIAPLHKGFQFYYWVDTPGVKPSSMKAPASAHEATPAKLVPFFRNCPTPFFLRQLIDHIRYHCEGFYKKTMDRYMLSVLQEQLILRRRDQPIFFFINWMTAHNRYHPFHHYQEGRTISPYDWSSEYDLALKYCDSRLQDLIDIFRQAGEIDRTVFVLTSDHGELLGEYDIYGHHKTLFEPVLHVPLIFAWTGWPDRETIDIPVSIVHLKDTLVQLADHPLPALLSRNSLAEILIAGGKVVAEHRSPGPEEGFRAFTYIDREGNKLIYDEQMPSLSTTWGDAVNFTFILAHDPCERDNVSQTQQALTKRLLREYHDWERKTPRASFSTGPVEFTPGMEERLRALGYIE